MNLLPLHPASIPLNELQAPIPRPRPRRLMSNHISLLTLWLKTKIKIIFNLIPSCIRLSASVDRTPPMS